MAKRAARAHSTASSCMCMHACMACMCMCRTAAAREKSRWPCTTIGAYTYQSNVCICNMHARAHSSPTHPPNGRCRRHFRMCVLVWCCYTHTHTHCSVVYTVCYICVCECVHNMIDFSLWQNTHGRHDTENIIRGAIMLYLSVRLHYF